MLPHGRMLPVHCCCDPNKRIGWVPAEATRPRGVVFIAGHPVRDLVTGDVTEPDRIHTEIAELIDGGESMLAVKSADVPIETWRKVPGFVEDQWPKR